MTQPLALVLYEKLLPGTQLVNKLQDLGYRVSVVEDPGALVRTAEQGGPLIVFCDLQSERANVLELVSQLRSNPPTNHLPVVAFSSDENEAAREAAKKAGVTLLASEAALADHLPQVLEQALRVD